MGIEWSDDCLSCLCSLPHTVEEHLQVVLHASAELQAELQELERINGGLPEEDEERSLLDASN